jgi:hypothetical protein
MAATVAENLTGFADGHASFLGNVPEVAFLAFRAVGNAVFAVPVLVLWAFRGVANFFYYVPFGVFWANFDAFVVVLMPFLAGFAFLAFAFLEMFIFFTVAQFSTGFEASIPDFINCGACLNAFAIFENLFWLASNHSL